MSAHRPMPGAPTIRFVTAPTLATPNSRTPLQIAAADLFGDGRQRQLVTYADQAGNVVLSSFMSDRTGAPGFFIDSAAPGDSGPMTVGDFDGDGHQDAAIIRDGQERVDILLSRGGPLVSAGPLTLNGVLVALAAGDFDGDGLADLVVSDASGSLAFAHATGGGTFAYGGRRDLHARPDAVVVADLDSDGALDIAVVVAPEVAVLLGNGDGTFGNVQRYATGALAGPLAAADVDGDGALDLVESPADTPDLSVLHGIGDGTFAPAVLAFVAPSSGFQQLFDAGDLDGDGTDDLFARTGISATVVLGACDGTLRPGASYEAGALIIAGDLDGDGVLDVGAASNPFGVTGPGQVSALLSTEGGRLHAARRIGESKNIIGTGDFDDDGRADLVFASSLSGRIDLILGKDFFDPNTRPQVLEEFDAEPTSIVVDDLDGDGNLDFAVAGGDYGGLIRLFFGDGCGGFPRRETLGANASPARLATGHFSRHHHRRRDLVFAGRDGVYLLANMGHGQFGAPQPVGLDGRVVTVADFNGDGKDDIAAATPGFVHVALGRGNRTFGPIIESNSAPIAPTDLWNGDFDADGRVDIVEASTHPSQPVETEAVSVFRGNGAGGFGVLIGGASSERAGSAHAAIGDFNGDGIPDLSMALWGRVEVHEGHQGAPMTRAATYPMNGILGASVAADVDGDGRLDVAVADNPLLFLHNDSRRRRSLIDRLGRNQPF